MTTFQCSRCGQWVGSLQVHEVGNGCYPPSYTTINATNTIPPLPILPAPIEQGSVAVLCPVCAGTGNYKQPKQREAHPCHGCDGKGWVKL